MWIDDEIENEEEEVEDEETEQEEDGGEEGPTEEEEETEDGEDQEEDSEVDEEEDLENLDETDEESVDRFLNELEEGLEGEDETSEEDDDDDNEEGEGEDEGEDDDEGDDEDEEGDKKGKDILDEELLEEEDREELEDLDKLGEDELYTAFMDVESYRDWIRAGENQGVEVDMGFAKQVAQNDLDPAELTEQGIYSFSDLTQYMQELKDRVDPEAIIVPKKDDKEGWKIFNEQLRGIPDRPSGYSDELFEGTFLEDNDEGKSYMREMGFKVASTPDELKHWIHVLDGERRAVEEESEEKFQNYKEEQLQKMQETFGADTRFHLRSNYQWLKSYGQELLEEFRGTEVLSSSSLNYFLTRLREANEAKGPPVKMKEFTSSISRLSLEQLKLREDALYKQVLTDENKNSKDPKKRAKYERGERIAWLIDKELQKRGEN